MEQDSTGIRKSFSAIASLRWLSSRQSSKMAAGMVSHA